MRKFIDPTGFFQIHIPETWRYEYDGIRVHTFFDEVNLSVFQISFNLVNERVKTLFTKLKQVRIGKRIFYIFLDKSDDKDNIIGWMGKLDGYVIAVTFINPTSSKFSPKLKSTRNLIYSIIKTINLINPDDREYELSSYLLGQFIKGLFASEDLLEKSIVSKSFIQAVIIFANQIDSLLRTGIILKEQLNNKNSEINRKYLYQGDEDKIISEKEIYNQAKQMDVIDKLIYDSLIEMYKKRNQVVHRYIISDITTVQVEKIAAKYYDLREDVKRRIVLIENEQIEKGIGMTVKGSPEIKKRVHGIEKGWLIEKHGMKNIFNKKL